MYHTLSSYGWEFCWTGNNAVLPQRSSILTRSPWCLPGLWHVGRTGIGGVEVGSVASFFPLISWHRAPELGGWSPENYESMRNRLTLQITLAPSRPTVSMGPAVSISGPMAGHSLGSQVPSLAMAWAPCQAASIGSARCLALSLAGTYFCLRF